jgi:hypothetical protein
MESRFLKFTQFIPTALEPRYVSIRSDTIAYFYLKRTGDLFCTCIASGSTDFEVAESYEDVERAILTASVKDSTGT